MGATIFSDAYNNNNGRSKKTYKLAVIDDFSLKIVREFSTTTNITARAATGRERERERNVEKKLSGE